MACYKLYPCLEKGCGEMVPGFWCTAHRPRWGQGLKGCEFHGHVWLSGAMTLMMDKPGVLVELPDPPEGQVYEICKFCDEVRTVARPRLANRSMPNFRRAA